MLSKAVTLNLRKEAVKALLTMPKRFGSGVTALPVNYAKVHLHNPYDYFDANKTGVFDPLVTNNKSVADCEIDLIAAYSTLDEEVEAAYNAIEDPEEKEAFDNIFRPILTDPTEEELSKPYGGPHFLYDRLNNPDSAERTIPRRFGVETYYDCFVADAFRSTITNRAFFIGGMLLSVGSAAYMAGTAVYEINYYFQHMGEEHH